MMELDSVAYNQALYQSEIDDEVITKELESDDLYKTQYLMAKLRITSMIAMTPESVPRTTITNAKTKFPKLGLPKFSDNVKE